MFQKSQILDELIPLAHTKSCVTFSSRSTPARDSGLNLLYHLANQMSRGFLSADDQFRARRLKLLVFVLAAFCWTKSLLCNVVSFTGMLLYQESTLQLCSSRRFYEVFKDLFRFPVSRLDDVVFRPDAHQSATSARTMRSFRPDAHQCLEASNSSRLHPSGRNGKSSGRSSEFKKIQLFQSTRPDDVVIPSGRHSVFDKK
jgi:hypothetical protein